MLMDLALSEASRAWPMLCGVLPNLQLSFLKHLDLEQALVSHFSLSGNFKKTKLRFNIDQELSFIRDDH